ncbi:ubiquitin-related domain-containing protein [Glomus cerebriforme]|uniref:Ubiquitin-related domain-containing protein n=1 Tax=Glomus cerebriforme TaxID=658196 RepID=A0A397SKW9_9GLOM|nr:ubiquitin-related domain-containing protein [Glomus cerebriforme]
MSTEPQDTPIQSSNNADTSQPSVTKTLSADNNGDSKPTTTVVKTPTQSENRKSQSGGDSTTSSSASSSQQDADSEDKVKLTLLLVSGKRHTFSFDPTDTITVVKSRVFNNWPKEWADETPVAVSSLKIVYQGRFLEDGTTLETNKILRGQSTIVHLTIKNVSQHDNDGPKSKDEAPKCHCIIL